MVLYDWVIVHSTVLPGEETSEEPDHPIRSRNLQAYHINQARKSDFYYYLPKHNALIRDWRGQETIIAGKITLSWLGLYFHSRQLQCNSTEFKKKRYNLKVIWIQQQFVVWESVKVTIFWGFLERLQHKVLNQLLEINVHNY